MCASSCASAWPPSSAAPFGGGCTRAADADPATASCSSGQPQTAVVSTVGSLTATRRPAALAGILSAVRFSEIVSRMTGISTPIFGVSWTPPTSDVEVARRVIAYLENRRVLYDPLDIEVPRHCLASVMEIRQFLTDQIGAGGIAEELAASLRAMRAVCHKFLEDLGPVNARLDGWEARRWHGGYGGLDDYLLNQALGALRAVFGIHVGQLAVRYGIDVEDRLASILPATDEES
jgi:hypothetical protein